MLCQLINLVREKKRGMTPGERKEGESLSGAPLPKRRKKENCEGRKLREGEKEGKGIHLLSVFLLPGSPGD